MELAIYLSGMVSGFTVGIFVVLIWAKSWRRRMPKWAKKTLREIERELK